VSGKEHLFSAEVVWEADKSGRLSIAGHDLTVATAPAFQGPEGTASPQELFVASAVTCVMTTFLFMAKKIRADWKSFSCRGCGTVTVVSGQGPLFQRIDLYPRVSVPNEEQAPLVERALHLSNEYCMVTRAMNIPVCLHPNVVVEP
jgi:organic hydroperoxide reductase OsmC/OhrA